MTILENIPLAERTTIGLGGPARYFAECVSADDIKEGLLFAKHKNMRLYLLAGGSNTIFSDRGFDGLVMKVALRGTTINDEGSDVTATVRAGEEWDPFVLRCVESGYAGVECLSGIPGSVGATPIQNVGAYGQEVQETIVSVKAIDRTNGEETLFTNPDCRFSYRFSRFKSSDADRYIITDVTYRLKKNGRPTIHYPEVKKQIDAAMDLSSLADGSESLHAVRSVVLSLRKKKSMVIDPADPNSRSVGSFFLNPVVESSLFEHVSEVWKRTGDGSPVPSFPTEQRKKIPAAWLIERSGFTKGYSKNGVGISENHPLALVNRGGTSAALMELAAEIQSGVFRTFGVRLEREANVVL